jgi:hypothetical protein
MKRFIGHCGIIFVVLFILISLPIAGQELVWSVNYGGQYNEEGYSGTQTSDGNYAVLGNTYSKGAGKYDFYLLKINMYGDTLWSRTYGGSDTEYGYDIHRTPDGGLILAGSTQSFGSGGRDIYIIRTDQFGNTLWAQTYGGAGDDEARSVRSTSDNGFIICGTTDSYGAGYNDLYLIRINSSGDTLWTRTFGGAGGESGSSVRQTTDNGFIAIGSTGSFGDGYSSIYAIRLDAYGDSLWARTFGGTRADFGSCVEIAADGGLLIVGRTASFGAGFYDAYLVKTDADGNVEWDRTYGTARDNYAYSVYLTRDGGYLLSGVSEVSASRKLDAYLIKTDPMGYAIWERTYGGNEADYGRMVFQEQGFDYIMIGHTYSFSSGGSDIYVLKVSGEITDSPEDEAELLPEAYKLYQNYPNPFNLSTTIDFSISRRATVVLKIYNILGQEMREWKFESLPSGLHSVNWDGVDKYEREIASGVYFYRLETADYVETRKMVLLK